VEEVFAVENAEDAAFGEDGSILLTSTDSLLLISRSGQTKTILEERVRFPVAIRGSEWVLFEAGNGVSRDSRSSRSRTRHAGHWFRTLRFPVFFHPILFCF
jgi:hypothetical protein